MGKESRSRSRSRSRSKKRHRKSPSSSEDDSQIQEKGKRKQKQKEKDKKKKEVKDKAQANAKDKKGKKDKDKTKDQRHKNKASSNDSEKDDSEDSDDDRAKTKAGKSKANKKSKISQDKVKNERKKGGKDKDSERKNAKDKARKDKAVEKLKDTSKSKAKEKDRGKEKDSQKEEGVDEAGVLEERQKANPKEKNRVKQGSKQKDKKRKLRSSSSRKQRSQSHSSHSSSRKRRKSPRPAKKTRDSSSSSCSSSSRSRKRGGARDAAAARKRIGGWDSQTGEQDALAASEALATQTSATPVQAPVPPGGFRMDRIQSFEEIMQQLKIQNGTSQGAGVPAPSTAQVAWQPGNLAKISMPARPLLGGSGSREADYGRRDEMFPEPSAEVIARATAKATQSEEEAREVVRKTGQISRGPPGLPTGVMVINQKFIDFLIGPNGQSLAAINYAAGVNIVLDQSHMWEGYTIAHIYGSEDSTKRAKLAIEYKTQQWTPRPGSVKKPGGPTVVPLGLGQADPLPALTDTAAAVRAAPPSLRPGSTSASMVSL